jgi:hypothetical protein
MLRWIVLAHLLSGLMFSPYLAHIHITSQTFTVNNLPGGFTSGLIRSCITCVIRTDKALLNGSTSHGTNIRHIFFKPKILCSYRRRSIIQYNMRNQCNNLFTCIIDYLYVLCIILMILSCVLCITLMMFIYVYYRLFLYINLADIISLCFTVFSFHLPVKVTRFLAKITQKLPRQFLKNRLIYRETGKFFGETGRFLVSPIFTVHPSSLVRFN